MIIFIFLFLLWLISIFLYKIFVKTIWSIIDYIIINYFKCKIKRTIKTLTNNKNLLVVFLLVIQFNMKCNLNNMPSHLTSSSQWILTKIIYNIQIRCQPNNNLLYLPWINNIQPNKVQWLSNRNFLFDLSHNNKIYNSSINVRCQCCKQNVQTIVNK